MTTRRKLAALVAMAALAARAHDDEHEPPIARTAMIHGAAGPFAVAGYRMGENALLQLGLKRGSIDLDVVHHSPSKVQWACIVDGIQAATGASLGKMNLQRIEAKETYSLIGNRKTGQRLRFELTPAFVKMYYNLSLEKQYEAGLKTAEMKESEVFRVR